MIKKLARLILGEYSVYFIYRWSQTTAPASVEDSVQLDVRPIDEAVLLGSTAAELSDQVGYLGPESVGFGCFINQRLVGTCFYWHSDRYKKRNFWPLRDTEAKLVQIIVQPEMRGRGAARALILRSAVAMANRGFPVLFARVWHSNLPSIQAFQRAGWKRIAVVFEINPFRSVRPIRIQKNLH